MRNPHRVIAPATRAYLTDQLMARHTVAQNVEMGTAILVNRALDAGMSYTEVATYLGISRSTLYRRYVITERQLPL